jgi:flagellar hook protein FlgE
MLTALFSGVSGLQNHQTELNVIGNNIANVNTVGFKGGRVTFAEALVQRLRGARGSDGNFGGMNPMEIGLGMRLASVDQMFGQGNLEATGNSTDMAIQGDGFFILSDGEQSYYTRAGAFQMDADGYLMAQGGGLYVLGQMADAAGVIGSDITQIQLPVNEKAPAYATTEISYYCNLDAGASQAQVWTANLAFTSNNSPALTSTEINDLDQVNEDLDDDDTIIVTGTDHDGNAVSVTFTYGATNDGTTLGDLLTIVNSAAGYNSTGANGSTASLDASGKLVLTDNQAGPSETTISMTFADTGSTPSAMSIPTFLETTEGTQGSHSASIYVYDSLGEQHRVEITFLQDVTQDNHWTWEIVVDNGAINASNGSLSGNTGDITFNPDGSVATFNGGPLSFTPAGALPMVIDLNGGTQGSFAGITQFSSPSTTIAINQDGYGMGILESFTVNTDGVIVGNFSNGVTRNLAQVSLARFNNPAGLESLGGNLFRQTMNSGEALIGANTDERGGTIHSGYLEMSNVDLSQEFTRMIVAQRGFQANARVITTSD